MPAFQIPGGSGSLPGQGWLSDKIDQENKRKATEHLITCTAAKLIELKEKLIQLEKQRKLNAPRFCPNGLWQLFVSETSDIALLDKVIKAIQKEKSPTTQTIVDALWQPDNDTRTVCDASLWIKAIEKRMQGTTVEKQEMQCLKKTV